MTTRNASQQLMQPTRETRGRQPSEPAVTVDPLDADAPHAHPVLKSFFKQLNDQLRAELTDFFDYVEIKFSETKDTVLLGIRREIDGLRETCVIVINRVMKGFHSLNFEQQTLEVRLAS